MKKILQILSSTGLSSQQRDLSLLLFRIGLAWSIINTHGVKKVVDISGTIQHIPDPLGIGGLASTLIAIFANIILASFVGIGLFTRPSALVIAMITLVGLLFVHAADPWSVKDVPFMYTLSFGLLVLLGPGKYALDHRIQTIWLQSQS